MREALAANEGHRLRWTATFVRFGSKPGFKGRPPERTLLVRDVKDSAGKVVADHLWFNVTKEFDALALEEGLVLSFEARVTKYEKGYKGNRLTDDPAPVSIDFRLSHPTKVWLVNAPPPPSDWMPDDREPEPKEQLGLFV